MLEVVIDPKFVESSREKMQERINDIYVGSYARFVNTVLVPQIQNIIEQAVLKTIPEFAKGKPISAAAVSSEQAHEILTNFDDIVCNHRNLWAEEPHFPALLVHIEEVRAEMKRTIEAQHNDVTQVLRQKGIYDRKSFLRKGPAWFKRQNFGNFGGAFAFVAMILGRSVKNIDLEVLEETADKIGFVRQTREQEGIHFREILVRKGILNREDFIGKGVNWFKQQDFEEYGRVFTFFGAILRGIVTQITTYRLEQVADVLYPETKDERKRKFLALLNTNGYYKWADLRIKGPSYFKKQKFGIYGGGHGFLKEVLQKPIPFVTIDLMKEMAVELGMLKSDTRAEEC